MSLDLEHQKIQAQCERWIREFVIGHKLCPYAAAPLDNNQVTLRVCDSDSPEEILRSAFVLLDDMQQNDNISTALLICSAGLSQFDHFYSVVEHINDILEDSELIASFQLASFHPQYQFSDEPIDAPSQYTNRSPYPLLHWLRQSELSEVVMDEDMGRRIADKNQKTMEHIGQQSLQNQLDNILNS